MEAEEHLLRDVVGGVRIAHATPDEGAQPAVHIRQQLLRSRSGSARLGGFGGYWHPHVPDVGSGQQLVRSAGSQHVRCVSDPQHPSASFDADDGCVDGAAAGGSGSVLIGVVSLLIMNIDERQGKWMHASPPLHPFWRPAVLRGMTNLRTPAIETLDLCKRYRDGTEVLRGVSFAVEPGTIFGYLGRNGAGKSTTVRILSTLTLPSGGSARVEGIDVQADPGGVRSRIGVAMQGAALDDYATARQHLKLLARLTGLPRRAASERADELLEQFDLAGAADTRLARLSGGTRRRVDIATALITRPRVLFLDEPTTGLDPQSRRALWRELRAQRDAGAAILLTTQYMDEASELADVVAVLDDGRVAALDAPGRLVAHASREVVELRLTDPAQRDRVRLAAGAAVAVAGDGNGTVRFELPTENDRDGAVALMARIEELAIPIGSIRIEQPSLEDAFLRLTGTAIDEAKAA